MSNIENHINSYRPKPKDTHFLKVQLVYKLLDIIGKYNSIFYFHKQSKKCVS